MPLFDVGAETGGGGGVYMVRMRYDAVSGRVGWATMGDVPEGVRSLAGISLYLERISADRESYVELT